MNNTTCEFHLADEHDVLLEGTVAIGSVKAALRRRSTSYQQCARIRIVHESERLADKATVEQATLGCVSEFSRAVPVLKKLMAGRPSPSKILFASLDRSNVRDHSVRVVGLKQLSFIRIWEDVRKDCSFWHGLNRGIKSTWYYCLTQGTQNKIQLKQENGLKKRGVFTLFIVIVITNL